MDQNTLIIVGAIAAGFIGLIFALIKILPLALKKDINKISSLALDKNTESFLTIARDVLGSEKDNIKDDIKTDLSAKKDMIREMIQEIRQDLKKNEDRILKSDEDRVSSFSALERQLKEYKEITGELKTSTEGLRNLLSNNQMRGAFGEQVAENLLKMAGFVIGEDYVVNKQQKSKTRPDFTLFLPDKTKINIDVKFPYSSLLKVVESKNNSEKEQHNKQFKVDVREKIKQVSTRDYINPEEKTVDFVILFVPNEMIFSYIYEKMNDVWEDAMAKKVIMAGPFSFTAILRMVKQSYENFRYQENLQEIITLIQRFDKEYEKYSASVDKLGERIDSAAKQFNVVEGTRNKQLTSIVSKIKIHEIDTPDATELLPDASEE